MKDFLVLFFGLTAVVMAYEAGKAHATADALADDLDGALALADAANHELRLRDDDDGDERFMRAMEGD